MYTYQSLSTQSTKTLSRSSVRFVCVPPKASITPPHVAPSPYVSIGLVSSAFQENCQTQIANGKTNHINACKKQSLSRLHDKAALLARDSPIGSFVSRLAKRPQNLALVIGVTQRASASSAANPIAFRTWPGRPNGRFADRLSHRGMSVL